MAVKEAEAHLTKAIELLETMAEDRSRNEQEVELRLALAVPLTRLHGYGSSEVEACAQRAKQLCDELDDHPTRFAAYRLNWNSCMMRHPAPNALALARELMASAQGGGDPAQLAIAYRALGLSLFYVGDPTEADALFADCARLADSIPDAQFSAYGEHPGMIGRLYGGHSRCVIGFATQGVQLIEAGVTHARPSKSRLGAVCGWNGPQCLTRYIRSGEACREKRLRSRVSIDCRNGSRLGKLCSEGRCV